MPEWEITRSLFGRTLDQTWIPFKHNTGVISALGGEFRIILSANDSKPSTETRDNIEHKDVLDLVFAQNNNTRISLGKGNPFFAQGTKGIPLAMIENTINKLTLNNFWFSIDPSSGWFYLGNGEQPG